MWGLSNISYLFCNKFNKIENTGVLMIDSICHKTVNLLWNCVFCFKTLRFYHILVALRSSIHTVTEICKPLVVYRFYCMVLHTLQDDIKFNGIINIQRSLRENACDINKNIVSENDQEIPQSQTADNPVAPRGRAAQTPWDTKKTN